MDYEKLQKLANDIMHQDPVRVSDHEKTLQELELQEYSEYGATRITFIQDQSHVIKIPLKEMYKELNKREVENYNKYQDLQVLAPIEKYADNYSWIQMRRCDISKGHTEEFIKKLENQIGIKIRDLKHNDIGTYKDRSTDEYIQCAVDYPSIIELNDK